MMSQMEIWAMQDYCREKNSDRYAAATGSRQNRQSGKRLYSMWSLALLIVGLILMTLSGCLMAFLVTHIETGMSPGFFAVCGIGIAVGAALTAVSRLDID